MPTPISNYAPIALRGTFTDTEYWERGGGLAYTTPDGSKDVALLENVRLYHFAGAPHNVGKFAGCCQWNPRNQPPYYVRLSIEERYPSRDEYLKRVRAAGDTLVKKGYLLADDLDSMVKHAGEHWDLLIGKAGVKSTRAER